MHEFPAPETDLYKYALKGDQAVVIDPEAQPVYDLEGSYDRYGIDGRTVAVVEAGGMRFGILDMDGHPHYDSPFVVAQEFERHGMGFKGIWPDQPLTIGRAHHADIFDYNPRVSNNHFTVLYDGTRVTVNNLKPTNETLVSGGFVLDQQSDDSSSPDDSGKIWANYTRAYTGESAIDPSAPHGRHRGYAIIGRDTRSVKDGVYFTRTPMSEAVLVDGNAPELQLAVEGLLHKINGAWWHWPKNNVDVPRIATMVNNHTTKLMRYDLAATEALSRPYAANNDIIPLSTYIKEGVAVCRQQNLLAAFLMEALTEHSILPENSQVSVERNAVRGEGGHAWAVLAVPDMDELIVDPAQRYVGTRDQAAKEDRWRYRLPSH